jgi:SAM-dependent methyltransferase
MPLEWKAPPGLLGDRQNVRGVFETIYDKKVWGGGSGIGSSPQVAGPYMNLLQAFLNNNPIRSVVDIGCGDWQFSRYINWGDRTYLGIDVVASVIEANREKFARSNVSFSHANPLEDGFDVGGDLLLMKDILQHLSNSNVQKLLRLTSRFRFSLLTNAYAVRNDECENGDTRPLDIRTEPFNLKNAARVYSFAEKATFLVINDPPASTPISAEKD